MPVPFSRSSARGSVEFVPQKTRSCVPLTRVKTPLQTRVAPVTAFSVAGVVIAMLSSAPSWRTETAWMMRSGFVPVSTGRPKVPPM